MVGAADPTQPTPSLLVPPILNVAMVPNLTNPLLSNVKVRESISYAIDRSQVSNIGESGYEPPANQTGIVTPTFSGQLDNQALASWGSGFDVAKAKALLATTLAPAAS
jgi:peptide/nickel transport system substrate-binding protein